MIVVVVLFVAGWLLLRLEGKGLDALGFNRPARRFATSVLGEELLFRGYLLYQAMRFAGRNAGLLISAAAFGVVGNIPVMIVVFFFTGAFGFMAALAFRQTGSLGAPIGLHLGWNLVVIGMLSSGPIGKVLLIPSAGTLPLQSSGAAGLLIGLALPLAVIAAVAWFLFRCRSPAQAN